MKIEQLYTNCLAEAAYYIESDGEAAIIDPIRETEPYVKMASDNGVKIKYVFETHFHADFVSGHIDLAKKTGATIIFGPGAETNYEVYNAKDGEEFKIGKITIKALHTPGHTPESTSYLLMDEKGKEHAIFTGDTLFVGDVGRPDLLDGKMTKEELAGMLYESLNNKIKPLADEVILYPGHGPGSSCGKNIGPETWSTIGAQKKSNYALQEMTKAAFIEAVTRGLSEPPAYFFKDAMINKDGYDPIDEVMERNTKALAITEVEQAIADGVIVLDTRDPDDFEKGFVKGSINIGLKGMYAIWVGTLIDINKEIVVVAYEGKEEEAILRLARVGYENVKGYLKGGVAAWKNAGKEVETITSEKAQDFNAAVKEGAKVLDVRRSGEFESGHVAGAQHICLTKLPDQLDQLDKDQTYHVHCAGGYRSMIAASLLKSKGFNNLVNVYGGWEEINKTDVPMVNPELA